ncbi:MAG: sodium:proton antiporter [Verrucomicrobia bacterium]|nr:sodium:proton antiporter [Verrucomicrobiota bacterium]
MAPDVLQPHPLMMAPFGLLLLAIALAPLFCPGWWGRHYPKVSFTLGALTLGYYLIGLQAAPRVLEVAHEYVSFIALIGSLFVVSGGIHIIVKGEATPGVNVAFLLVGALLANVLGTTGASMLLLRPWIRMNKYRVTAHHIVFFIFIVSNVGGCLTPIGDPPLFLGYLRGVPFWWVAEHCWPMWAAGLGILLAMFYVVDSINFRRAPREVREKETAHETWRFEGLGNVFYLAVILGAVFIEKPLFLREALMVGAAIASYRTTNRQVHEANDFNFHPINEVAILFAGIFLTMMPALDWLQGHAGQMAGLTPTFYYWATGALSSVLDNAPTYLSFLSAAAGPAVSDPAQLAALLERPGFARDLVAISVGAVFFGAATYIGNGPNFMVKAIAEQNKVRVPGFLGYVFKYSLPFLLPMLVVVWLLFFRG